MRLTFLGADHEVTGSCHFLQVAGKNILIDCGMEQGNDVYENQEIPVNPSDLDYILVTHAHIDHTGLIPLMYVKGFRGSVYATSATCDLCDILLRDSAHIQMFEAEWRNRKAKRSKLKEFVPLFDMEAVENVLKQFVPCEYDEIINVCDGVKIRFSDVGHLLGSASIEVWLTEGDVSKKIVFSGDIGNINKPLVREPKYTTEADYVVMESTYGDRSHGEVPDYVKELAEIFKSTFAKGGNVVIPSFAVGRTQELLYFIRKIKEDNLVGDFEVYMDSPLAIEATSIFNKNSWDYYDEEALAMIEKGINPLVFPGLKLAVSSDQSKAINMDNKPKVIISASGMCEAGRIRHHLKHNLWRQECTILFVGYQANGTLGRIIVDGATEVKLFGEPIEVRANIARLAGCSGHADKEGLLRWINAFTKKPETVFVVHGEDSVCDSFRDCLEMEHGFDAVAPYTGACYDLVTGAVVEEGHTEKRARRVTNNSANIRKNNIFQRLIAAGKRLMTVIAHNEGGANKDLAKFTDQINALCDKWDR